MKRIIEEPKFDMQKDIIMMTKDERQFKEEPVTPSFKANVLILSYNRPKMLRQAIESVLEQQYGDLDIYIVDDGSDFDVWGIIKEFENPRLLLAQAPKIPVEERVKVSRLGRNLNSVIETLDNDDVVFYLCDDDIMAPNWILRAMIGFINYPAIHVVAGESWYFDDGQDWRAEARYGLSTYEASGIPIAYWSTGSFGHRVKCCKEEGVWWKDNYHLHSQDANFILDLWNLHSDYLYIPSPSVYRREHPKALSAKLGRKDEEGRYKPGYIPPPAKREHIEGMME